MTLGRLLFIVAIALGFAGLLRWRPLLYVSGLILAVSFAIDVFVS